MKLFGKKTKGYGVESKVTLDGREFIIPIGVYKDSETAMAVQCAIQKFNQSLKANGVDLVNVVRF